MIHCIQLENWFAFEKLALDLDDPLTLFVGPNGAGKSAIRDAIVFALTGTLRTRRGVTKKNEIAQVALRDGAKHGFVEVLFRGGLRVTRRLTPTGQTLELRELPEGAAEQSIPGTQGELQALLYERLGVDEDRALAVLDSRHFLRLDEDARKALLFRAIGAGVTGEAILKALDHRDLRGVDAEMLATVAARAGFRKAEKDAIELRRSAKRDLEALTRDRAFAPQVVQGTKGEIDLAKVTLADLEAATAKLSAELEATAKKAGTSIASAKATAEAFRKGVIETEAELEAARDADPDAVKARIADLEASEREVMESISQHRLALEEARQAESGEVVKPEVCPAISGFQCPATPKQLAAHAKKLEEVMAAAAMKRAESSAALSKLTPELNRIREEVGTARAELAEHKRLAEKVPALEKSLSRMRDQLEHAEQVSETLEAAGQEQVDLAPLRERVKRGHEIIVAKKAWDADVAARAGESAKREEAEKAIARADRLVKAFEPDGIEQDIVRDSLAPLRERLALTGGIFGTGSSVSLADDLSLDVRIRGQVRSESQLSEGQWHALGLLVQDALAALPAFPVLLFDEFELLVQQLRSAVVQRFFSLMNDPYGSVFFFGATDKQIPNKPKGVGVVWCREPGVAEVL